MTLQLKFLGGVGTVTGSKYLVDTGNARIATSNTISHQSNAINVSAILADATSSVLRKPRPSRT
ncbi:hypothetical protein [Hyphomonas sp.]|uniref:hypothetical protein n=1 Tax=Hyphomonas sp. TaxID=87 RepID=UPI003565505F